MYSDFSPKFYVIQNVDTKRTIGLGKQYNDLYYLSLNQNPQLAHRVNKASNLWNQRLGHPSTIPHQA